MGVLDFSGEAELIDKTRNCLENGGQEKDNLWRKDIRGNRVRHWSKLGRKAAH